MFDKIIFRKKMRGVLIKKDLGAFILIYALLCIFLSVLVNFYAYAYLIPILPILLIIVRKKMLFSSLIFLVVWFAFVAAASIKSIDPSIFLYFLPSSMIVLSSGRPFFRIEYSEKFINILIFILSTLIILIFFCAYDGVRSGLWFEDPNYAALFMVTSLSFLITISNFKNPLFLKLIAALALLLVVLITASRMALLACIIFVIMHLVSDAVKRLLSFAILFLGIFLQYYLHGLFNDGSFIASGYESAFSRLFVLMDSSNVERLSLAHDSIQFFFNQSFFDVMIGSKKTYFEFYKLRGNIPHNFVYQFLMLYGFVFTSFLIVLLVYIILRHPAKCLPLVAMLVFMGSTLGTIPILLLLICIAYLGVLIEAPKSFVGSGAS